MLLPVVHGGFPVRVLRSAVAAISLWILAACLGDSTGAFEEVRWERTDASRDIVAEAPDTVRLIVDHPALYRVWHRLKQSRLEWRVGSLDGTTGPAWGRIAGVASSPGGALYVLDGINVSIVVVSPAGEVLNHVLRDGDGPLEMRSPTGVLFTQDTLVVHSTSQVRFLSIVPEWRVAYHRSFQSPVAIYGLCSTPIGMLARVASPSVTGAVRRLDAQGAPGHAFGDLFHHEDPLVSAGLSSGLVACGLSGEWTVVSYDDGPVINGYGPGGDRDWSAYLADVTPNQVLIGEYQGTVGFRRPGERPSDRVVSIVRLTSEIVMLQVLRLGPPVLKGGRKHWEAQGLDSYIIEVGTGDGVFVGHHLPLIHEATEELLFGEAISARGFPVLEAHRW